MAKGLRIALVLLVAFVLSGCGIMPTPTPVPMPTPSEAEIYAMIMQDYTSPMAIMRVDRLSLRQIEDIQAALRAVKPPTDLIELHAQALRAYDFIYRGKFALTKPIRGETRAEAFFLVDWGIALLRAFDEDLEHYLVAQRGDEVNLQISMTPEGSP